MSVMPFCASKSTSAPRGSPAARVQPVQFPGFRFVDDGEQIAAHAVHRRFDYAERRVRGDRRIDRVAARLPTLRRRPATRASGWWRRCRTSSSPWSAPVRGHPAESCIVLCEARSSDSKISSRVFIEYSFRCGNRPFQRRYEPAANRDRWPEYSTSGLQWPRIARFRDVLPASPSPAPDLLPRSRRSMCRRPAAVWP